MTCRNQSQSVARVHRPGYKFETVPHCQRNLRIRQIVRGLSRCRLLHPTRGPHGALPPPHARTHSIDQGGDTVKRSMESSSHKVLAHVGFQGLRRVLKKNIPHSIAFSGLWMVSRLPGAQKRFGLQDPMLRSSHARDVTVGRRR